MKNKIQFSLLLTLARFLESDKCKKFNFGDYSGCSIRQCVKIWPNKWKSNNGESPSLLVGDYTTRESGVKFFGLNLNQYAHLFYPHGQKPRYYGGEILSDNATKFQAAKNIREFVKRKKKLTK